MISTNSLKNDFFIGFDRWQADRSHDLLEVSAWTMRLQPIDRCAIVALTCITALALLPLIALAGLAFSAIYLTRQYMGPPTERGRFHTPFIRKLLLQVLRGMGGAARERFAPRPQYNNAPLLAIEQDQREAFSKPRFTPSAAILQMVIGLVSVFKTSRPSLSIEQREALLLSKPHRWDRFNLPMVDRLFTEIAIPHMPLADGFDSLDPIIFPARELPPQALVLGCELPPFEPVESLDLERKCKQKSDQRICPIGEELTTVSPLHSQEAEKTTRRPLIRKELALHAYIQQTTHSLLNIIGGKDREYQMMNQMIQTSLKMLANFFCDLWEKNGRKTAGEAYSIVRMGYQHLAVVMQHLEPLLTANRITIDRTLTSFSKKCDEGESLVNAQQIPKALWQGIRDFWRDLQRLPWIGVVLMREVLNPTCQRKLVKFFKALITGQKVQVETTSWFGLGAATVKEKSADEILDDLLPALIKEKISGFIVQWVKGMFGIKKKLTRAQALNEVRNRIIHLDGKRIWCSLKSKNRLNLCRRYCPTF